MVIVWRLRGNIIRTALCRIVWHNVHSLSSSYRSNRLGLSHWDPYAVRRGGCLELYYCNMVEWFWWDSSLISTTNWFPSVLWHCWFGHLPCKNRPRNDLLCVELGVKPYTLTRDNMYKILSVSAVHHRSILLPLLRLTHPTEGVPGTISVKLCTEVKGWLRYKMAKKYCRKFQHLSRAHERYRR